MFERYKKLRDLYEKPSDLIIAWYLHSLSDEQIAQHVRELLTPKDNTHLYLLIKSQTEELLNNIYKKSEDGNDAEQNNYAEVPLSGSVRDDTQLTNGEIHR